jgi:hypothetical protein
MTRSKLVMCYAALGSLALALLMLPLDVDTRADFGVIDPRYRSPYSDTAWFLRQPGDTNSPVDAPDLAVPSGAPSEDSGPALAAAR